MAAQRSRPCIALAVAFRARSHADVGAPAVDPETRWARKTKQTRRRSSRIPGFCDGLDRSQYRGEDEGIQRTRVSSRSLCQYARFVGLECRNRARDFYATGID